MIYPIATEKTHHSNKKANDHFIGFFHCTMELFDQIFLGHFINN